MNVFSTASLHSRSQLHPLLQQLVDAAIKEVDFKILDALRGKIAQERAFRLGNTTVHFGQSAHNWVPAIAMDLFPKPYDWDDKQSFIHLQMNVIKPIAQRLKIPIRQGIDWNMNGVLTDEHFIDMPHVELHPWRIWAKQSKLYEE